MQFIDLKAQYHALQMEIDANIRAVLDSAQFIGGPYVKELENKLADFVGRKHCITCANGTDALQIAFMLNGVGRGDAVFCPTDRLYGGRCGCRGRGVLPGHDLHLLHGACQDVRRHLRVL